MRIPLLSIFLGVLVVRLVLRRLQLRHLRTHGSRVPEGFGGVVDPRSLERATAYTVANSRLGLVEMLVGATALAIFLFGGLLPLYDPWIASLTESFVLRGVLYFLGLSLIQYLLDLPFSLYRIFVLEERFGFNVTTVRLWLADQGKSLLISVLLLGILLSGGFALVRSFPDLWWLWVWGFFVLALLFLMILSPYVIEPLFLHFEPVDSEGLEEGIRDLAERAGLRVSQIRKVDASRRSRHSNAYFTGIGRVKRIVLFDTLLEQMENAEVLAILAHEIGHWKSGHVRKRLVRMGLFSLVFAWVAFLLLRSGVLPGLLGLAELTFFGQLVILFFLSGLLGFWFTPVLSALSRRQEWQADGFAAELTGRPQDLASALIKLGKENLANLHPHPLYAWFYYSHPPLVARVRRLRGK